MNQDLLDRVLRSPRLPSLPTIALEVIELAQQPEVEFREIAETIQHDPALSSKILKTVNSAFYGQVREISTISRALQVLGLNSVKTLALGFSLVGNLKTSKGAGLDHVEYWRRSLYTATAARALSRHAGIVQQEEAFLGGLLQDMGMVALSQALGDEYADILKAAGSRHELLRDHEIEALGIDHAEVGAALAESWKLPPVLVAPIRHHEEPDSADDELRTLVRSVALGNRAADVFLHPEGDGAALDTYYGQAASWFGLQRDQAELTLKEIHEQTQNLSDLFDLPTGNLGNPDEILARANEALMQITLQSQRENTQLITQVSTDALTEVSNRRALDQYMEEQFAGATEDRPVSVLFCDIDHFKQFNDTHGHGLGDRLLVIFAKTVRIAAGHRGRVFRYGGEEFVTVCPDASREAATRIAERVRKAVEEGAQVQTDGEQRLGVTCSIGVATHGGSTFDSVDALFRAADQALYVAKNAGRNCVRAHGLLRKTDAA